MPGGTGHIMKKAKLVIASVGIILALVIIFQNTATVETRFLFISIEMPRAALLGLTFVLGALVGLGLSLGAFRHKNNDE